MILENLRDDGQPQAGAALARGHVRLEQPLPVLDGKPLARIDDVHRHTPVLPRHGHVDAPVAGHRIGRLGDRFGGVLEDVRDRLRDEPPVERRAHRLLREVVDERDVRMRDPHHEGRLPHRVGHVFVHDRRFGHAREGGELVDHALYLVDLAHDRVGALFEDFAIGGDHLPVLAADSLGGELDRGQRVLDLVGDAPRHVCPGGGPLGGDEIGDVVQRDDHALLVAARLLGRDAHVDRPFAAAALNGDLLLGQPRA